MIVKDSEAIKRLSSPMNLINRLRENSQPKAGAMSLFGIGRFADRKPEQEEVKISFNPFAKQDLPAVKQDLPVPAPILSDILENSDSQIKLGLAHDNALKLLNDSIDRLTTKLDDVKADKLPSVIAAASKTVESIRRERNEAAKLGKDREVHYHFYTPEQKKVSDYTVIDVG